MSWASGPRPPRRRPRGHAGRPRRWPRCPAARRVADHAVREARDERGRGTAGLQVERVRRRGSRAPRGARTRAAPCRPARRAPGALAGRLDAALGVVVVEDGRLLPRHLADELLELHADHPALAAELDAGALDLLGHPRRQLGALETTSTSSRTTAFWNSSAVRRVRTWSRRARYVLECGERLVRLREDVRHLLELVAAGRGRRHASRAAVDRDDQRVRLLGDALAVLWRVPVSPDAIVGSGISWTFVRAG